MESCKLKIFIGTIGLKRYSEKIVWSIVFYSSLLEEVQIYEIYIWNLPRENDFE